MTKEERILLIEKAVNCKNNNDKLDLLCYLITDLTVEFDRSPIELMNDLLSEKKI